MFPYLICILGVASLATKINNKWKAFIKIDPSTKKKKRKENTLIQTHINIFNGHDLIWKQLNDILKESATFSVFNFPVKRMKRERKVVSQFAIKDSCKIENKKMVSNWKLRTINQLGNVSTNCINQRAGQRFCCSFEPSAAKQTVSGFKQ